VLKRDRQKFSYETWLAKAKTLPKDQFKQEVERELTGEDSEPWELVYFKLYKSQTPVIDRALEIAALMLGSDRSRVLPRDDLCGLSGRSEPGQR